MSDIESLSFDDRNFELGLYDKLFNSYRNKTTTSNNIKKHISDRNRPIYPPPLKIVEEEDEETIVENEAPFIPPINNFNDPFYTNTIDSTFLIGETDTIYYGNFSTIPNNENKHGIEVAINNPQNDEKVNQLFEEIYPDKLCLFPEDKSAEEEFKKIDGNKFMNKKRKRGKKDSEYPESRKYKEDNIRKKIVRHFFNSSFLTLINNRLTKVNSIIKLDKFSKGFTNIISHKNSYKVLNMTLRQIFKSEEFNEKENKIIKILESPEYKNIREATELDEILDRTFPDTFKEYLSSKEFIKNVNKIRANENNSEYYVKKYIYYSKFFIQRYNQSKEEC